MLSVPVLLGYDSMNVIPKTAQCLQASWPRVRELGCCRSYHIDYYRVVICEVSLYILVTILSLWFWVTLPSAEVGVCISSYRVTPRLHFIHHRSIITTRFRVRLCRSTFDFSVGCCDASKSFNQRLLRSNGTMLTSALWHMGINFLSVRDYIPRMRPEV